MKCLNCDEELTDRTTDFTLKVMLCKPCAVKVSRLKARLRSELEVLLATLDDSMRFGITTQEVLPADDDGASRQDLLEFAVRLDTKCRNTSRTTTSSRSSSPSANTADGSESSTKHSAPD